MGVPCREALARLTPAFRPAALTFTPSGFTATVLVPPELLADAAFDVVGMIRRATEEAMRRRMAAIERAILGG